MIKDYPFASNGKSCMISISAEERPSLKLTIEASSQKNRVGCCRIYPGFIRAEENDKRTPD